MEFASRVFGMTCASCTAVVLENAQFCIMWAVARTRTAALQYACFRSRKREVSRFKVAVWCGGRWVALVVVGEEICAVPWWFHAGFMPNC